MKNTILDHVLSVVCTAYKVTSKDMTAKQEAGRGRQNNITLARGAYMFISSEIGISGVAASRYIFLNKGNASTYRTKFIQTESEIKKERLRLSINRKLK